MQGLKVLSLLSSLETKKNSAHTREDDGLMGLIPDAKEMQIYFSIAFLFSRKRLKRQLVVKGAVGSRSMTQSNGWCSGRDSDLFLLKT